MNKKTFMGKMKSVDNNIASNIYEKILLASNINKTVYMTEFSTPNVWKVLESISNELDVGVYSYGIFEDAQRKMMAFSYDGDVFDYPITLIRIDKKSKFCKLGHRDYLGAIMSLGIKREKFGDLIVKGDSCYLAVQCEVSDYIRINLVSIGKSPCEVSILNVNDCEIPVYDFQDIVVNVSSLRVDCVISSLCNISRNKAEDLIRSDKVLVDYSRNFKRDSILKGNCVITISGYGKYKLVEDIGWTGSGKTKVLIKKFI